MNTIFEFTDRTSVYSKCIFASICHAVMVGKYTLLSDEISWDGTSFLFQNMEGTRGVISFSEKNFLCGIQSEENYLEGDFFVFLTTFFTFFVVLFFASPLLDDSFGEDLVGACLDTLVFLDFDFLLSILS